jgi:hypothetical protein
MSAFHFFLDPSAACLASPAKLADYHTLESRAENEQDSTLASGAEPHIGQHLSPSF